LFICLDGWFTVVFGPSVSTKTSSKALANRQSISPIRFYTSSNILDIEGFIDLGKFSTLLSRCAEKLRRMRKRLRRSTGAIRGSARIMHEISDLRRPKEHVRNPDD
jgi:hypothetical protein